MALKNYAVFNGRSRRKEFWMFTLFCGLFGLIPMAIDYSAGAYFHIGLQQYGYTSTIYELIFLLPGLAVGVRRLHDVGKSGFLIIAADVLVYMYMYIFSPPFLEHSGDTSSGWFGIGVIVLLLMMILGIWALVLFCKDGNIGENKYGANPKEEDDYQNLNTHNMNNTRPDNQSANQKEGTVPNDSNFGNSENKRKGTVPGNDDIPIKENPKNQNILAGFLVSFSKTEIGEYWEIREGNNSIGNSSDNSIKLNEIHVSGKHANINVSRDSQNNCWKFQIVDLSATNGTELNGEKLPIYSGKEIKNNDKIKIGEYQLLLIAVDKFVQNLNKNNKFQGSSQTTGYDSEDYFTNANKHT